MQAKQIDVGEVLDTARMGRLQWTAIGLCGLVAILDGFDNQSIAFVALLVAKDLQIAMADFGPIFSSGLFGLMVGTLLMGPVADRVGRRPVIIMSVLLFGLLTAFTPMATSAQALMGLRFLAGIGLGGALPNVIALTSEYAPKAKRATLVSLMFCGIPLGAVLGGLISTELMVRFGWRSVFYTGGILPLLLVPFLLALLPESLRYLAACNAAPGKLLTLLRRVDPAVYYADGTRCTAPEARVLGTQVGRLFADGRAPVTLLLWFTFFCNLLVMFFLISWLPSVLRQTNFGVEQAALATVVLNAGGVTGGLAFGRLVDHRVNYGVLAAAYAAGALVTALLGFAAQTTFPLFMLAIFGAGILILGLQFCMNAIAAAYYPTELRSTGIGWALGVGRTGSVVGPILGGLLIGRGWGTEQLFIAAAAPALLASVSVFVIKMQMRPERLQAAISPDDATGTSQHPLLVRSPLHVAEKIR